MFQRFARYIRPRNDNTMNYLEVPDNDADPKHPDTTWSRVDDIDQLNSLLTKQNKSHFAQAQGTPFTTPPLIDELTHSGVSPTGDEILQGTYRNPSLSPSTQLLIEHMKQRCLDLADQRITVEDLRGVFKTWRESTSTSPSGRHLGHMKTLTAINHDLD